MAQTDSKFICGCFAGTDPCCTCNTFVRESESEEVEDTHTIQMVAALGEYRAENGDFYCVAGAERNYQGDCVCPSNEIFIL